VVLLPTPFDLYKTLCVWYIAGLTGSFQDQVFILTLVC